MTVKRCRGPLTCTSTTCAVSSGRHAGWSLLAPFTAWATVLRFRPFSVLGGAIFGRLWVRLLAVTVIPVLITVVSVALLANYVTVGQFETFLSQDVQQRDDRLEQVLERFYQEQQGSWGLVGNTVQRMAALVGERVVVTDP